MRLAGSVTLKYAKRVNGLTALAVNHLDTIGQFDQIKVCVAYDCDGKVTEDFSTNLKFLNSAKPVYREFDGNFGEISDCKTFEACRKMQRPISVLLKSTLAFR